MALFHNLAGPTKTPSRLVARSEAIVAVNHALANLPKHYHEAIQLVHIEGRSARDAGERMGRTERAIHGLCRRGLKLLEKELQSASRFLSSTG